MDDENVGLQKLEVYEWEDKEEEREEEQVGGKYKEELGAGGGGNVEVYEEVEEENLKGGEEEQIESKFPGEKGAEVNGGGETEDDEQEEVEEGETEEEEEEEESMEEEKEDVEEDIHMEDGGVRGTEENEKEKKRAEGKNIEEEVGGETEKEDNDEEEEEIEGKQMVEKEIGGETEECETEDEEDQIHGKHMEEQEVQEAAAEGKAEKDEEKIERKQIEVEEVGETEEGEIAKEEEESGEEEQMEDRQMEIEEVGGDIEEGEIAKEDEDGEEDQMEDKHMEVEEVGDELEEGEIEKMEEEQIKDIYKEAEWIEEEGDRIEAFSLEPQRKRRREITLDRISALPDSLILQILSFLNLEEIVRSSIFSKRWQFFWTSARVLMFSKKYKEDRNHFVSRVQKTLILCRPKSLKKFGVGFLFIKRFASEVDTWIRFATQFKVKELVLQLGRYSKSDTGYELPQHLFNNASLRNLIVSHVIVSPAGIVRWPSLKTLTLESIRTTKEAIDKILSGCPVLEYLKMTALSGIGRLDINSTNLKKVVIKIFSSATHPLRISAPNIQSLDISGDVCGGSVRLLDVSSLVSARVEFNQFFLSAYSGNCEVIYYYVNDFFQRLGHVRELELGSLCILALSMLKAMGKEVFPRGQKVLSLNSYMDREFIPSIISLLQSSPDIETLVINRTYSGFSEILMGAELLRGERDSWRSQGMKSNCLLHRLKTIKITGFMEPPDRHHSMLTLVKFLLEKAKVLEDMVINAGSCDQVHCSSPMTPDFVKVALELLSLPRSSSNAKILFSP